MINLLKFRGAAWLVLMTVLCPGCGIAGRHKGSTSLAPAPETPAGKRSESPKTKPSQRKEAKPAAKAASPTVSIGDQPAGLEDGHETVSPDGKWTARLSPDFPAPVITITNRATGRATKIGGLIPDVYAMVWTPEADALVVVDHIAHGRVMRVFPRGSGAEWPAPRGVEDENEIVIAWGSGIAPLEITPLGKGLVRFRYGSTDWDTTDRHGPDEHPKYYISRFDYNIASGKQLNASTTAVSQKEAERKEMRPYLQYPPPMIQRMNRKSQGQ